MNNSFFKAMILNAIIANNFFASQEAVSLDPQNKLSCVQQAQSVLALRGLAEERREFELGGRRREAIARHLRRMVKDAEKYIKEEPNEPSDMSKSLSEVITSSSLHLSNLNSPTSPNEKLAVDGKKRKRMAPKKKYAKNRPNKKGVIVPKNILFTTKEAQQHGIFINMILEDFPSRDGSLRKYRSFLQGKCPDKDGLKYEYQSLIDPKFYPPAFKVESSSR